MSNEIAAYSHGKTNDKVFELICKQDISNLSILDVGAGEGYFSKLLGDFIYKKYALEVSKILKACDLFPEQFKYEKIPCDKVDINGNLPYKDKSFDIACSIEVIEHIEDQFKYVRELYRIIKENGRIIITTPNILNINSRLNFLHSGFWLLYEPLPLFKSEPVHLSGHINPISYYYLTYLLYKAGFKKVNWYFDRIKKSGYLLTLLLYPFVKFSNKLYCSRIKRKYPQIYSENSEILNNINNINMLSSRTLILEAIK